MRKLKKIEPRIRDQKFLHDFRTSNPRLHYLYLQSAMTHLGALEKVIRMLNEFSNLNMLGVTLAVQREVNKLVRTDAAYAEAADLISKYNQGLRK